MNSQNKIIAFANQKGGVGKTTTAINLATALAATKKRVLLIDFDPQGNASTGLGASPKQKNKNIYELISGNLNIDEAIHDTEIPYLHIIPATVDLSAVEVELVGVEGRENILKNEINKIKARFDYILIDCPPSLGMLTLNALTAADAVMIPMQCEFFALEGLSHLLSTIERVRKSYNPELDIHGILLTMHDKRNNLTHQVELDVRHHLGSRVYNTVIPRNIRVSEAPSHGKPSIIYDHKCSGSVAYIHLAREIISKERLAA